MKLLVTVEAEGTPEEIGESVELRALLDTLTSKPRTQDGAAEAVDEESLPEDAKEFLDEFVGEGEMRDVQAKLIAEVMGWGNVRLVWPESKETGERLSYLRLHRPGSRGGAFTYISRGRLEPRLDGSHASGKQFATEKAVKQSNPYQLQVQLARQKHLPEALELVRAAYDAAVRL